MAKNVKLSAKIALDVVMFLVLILLYKAKVLTLTFHEIAGIGILFIFLIHCLFNRRWIAANAQKLFSSDTPARTKFSYWICIAMVICLLITVISGVFISKVLFREQIAALGIDTSIFRTLHLFFAAISLILVSIHLGLYWDMVKGFFRKKLKVPARIAKPVSYVLLALIVVFGVYSVPTSGFGQWLLCPVIPIQHNHGNHGNAESTEAAENAERSGSGEAASEENAEQSSRSDTGERTSNSERTERNDQAESSERAERSSEASESTQNTGKQRSGNHGNNVTLSNILLTIARFTSIIGLFAAITYYIDKAMRRRKKVVH